MTTDNQIINAENRGESFSFADGRPRIFVFSVMKAELFFQKAD
jgi:hypothetical protein